MAPVTIVLIALTVGAAGLLIPRLITWAQSGLSVQKGLDLDRARRHADLAAIASYHRDHSEAAPKSISARTWDDLDMDAVFAAVDHAVSEPGRQYLYDALHRTNTSHAPLDRINALASTIDADAPLGLRLRQTLARLSDKRAAYLVSLLLGEVPKRPVL